MAQMMPGSYRGAAEGLVFDIRLGRSEDGTLKMVSGDATRDGAFVASFVCTEPREDAASGIVTGTVRFRGNPELFSGEIRLEVDDRGLGSFQLGVDLEGNYRDVFAGRLERRGSFMRRLTIEIDGLEGTEQPPSDGYTGRSGAVTIARAFDAAGFDTEVRIDPFRGRVPQRQRTRGYTLAEIHAAMEAVRSRDVADGLHVHVYVCSYLAGRDGRSVLGVMYDFAEGDINQRPREGVAVFGDHPMLSDPRVPKAERDREYIFTLVHEIGHALNLLHSFDKARPSSLSWMNYPNLYPRGYEAGSGHDGTAEFWRHFPDRFDAEELIHLHHATPREIAAGGLAFGTYEEGASRPFGGPAEPRLTRPGGNPLRAIGGVDLRVEPLKREYAFGEPVFLQVEVNNPGGRDVLIPDALDPTDGYLRVTFRSPSGRIIPYRPPVKFCRQAQLVRMPGGAAQPMRFDAAPVFLSAGGPVFTEPGDYQVTAELTGVDGTRVVYARPSVIRIVNPDRAEESFAERLWDAPAAMRALYLRHPLVARDAWNRLIKDRPPPNARGNTTASYFAYVSALGWLTPFAPTAARREFEADPERAAAYMDQVEPKGLPSSVARRKETLQRIRKADRPTAVALRRAPERMRAEIPPAGLFGALGLDGAKAADAAPRDPFLRVGPDARGTRRFADIVAWNMGELQRDADWRAVPRTAELIRNFRCDLWGLQEVDAELLARLTEPLNSAGRTRYAALAAEGRGPRCGVLYRTDTTTVSPLRPPTRQVEELFGAAPEVELARGGTARRPVFLRQPLLLNVHVTQGSSQVFDFRCAVVQVNGTDAKLKDGGAALRKAAAETLAAWIEADRGSGVESDYLVLGKLDAEAALDGFDAFSATSGLPLLVVGIGEGEGRGQALIRLGGRRTDDQVVLTPDAVHRARTEDPGQPIVIRSDTRLAEVTRDFSAQVPIAARFVLGSDIE